jgi:hypothetical protein
MRFLYRLKQKVSSLWNLAHQRIRKPPRLPTPRPIVKRNAYHTPSPQPAMSLPPEYNDLKLARKIKSAEMVTIGNMWTVQFRQMEMTIEEWIDKLATAIIIGKRSFGTIYKVIWTVSGSEC